jgi:hypothetical protein
MSFTVAYIGLLTHELWNTTLGATIAVDRLWLTAKNGALL